MPRTKRLKVKGEIAHYHIMSRTVGQQFLLGDTEKEILVQIIRYFSRMYFIKMNAYCIMSNHFHLVIRSLPNRMYSDKEVIRRIHTFINKKKKGRKGKNPQQRDISPEEILKARKKLEDISEFCRSFKQTFSCWYNRIHNRQFAPKSDRFCSFDGLFAEEHLLTKSEAALNRAYRGIVYYLGNITHTTLRHDFKLPPGEKLLGRIRYFTDGAVIGSKVSPEFGDV